MTDTKEIARVQRGGELQTALLQRISTTKQTVAPQITDVNTHSVFCDKGEINSVCWHAKFCFHDEDSESLSVSGSSPDSSSGEVIDSYVPMHSPNAFSTLDTVDELGRDEVELFMKTDDLEELFEIDGSNGAEADAPPAAAAAAAATASSADVAAVVAALGQVAQSRNTFKGSEGSGESVA